MDEQTMERLRKLEKLDTDEFHDGFENACEEAHYNGDCIFRYMPPVIEPEMASEILREIGKPKQNDLAGKHPPIVSLHVLERIADEDYGTFNLQLEEALISGDRNELPKIMTPRRAYNIKQHIESLRVQLADRENDLTFEYETRKAAEKELEKAKDEISQLHARIFNQQTLLAHANRAKQNAIDLLESGNAERKLERITEIILED